LPEPLALAWARARGRSFLQEKVSTFLGTGSAATVCGYCAALAVDRVYRIVARFDGVAATAVSHAPQGKITKGYLAFIQGLGSPLGTDPDPYCSVGTHLLLTHSSPGAYSGAHPAHPATHPDHRGAHPLFTRVLFYCSLVLTHCSACSSGNLSTTSFYG
jgi:hypothetical protein